MFGNDIHDSNTHIDNIHIECVRNDKHLGHKFGNNVCDSQIDIAIADIFQRCNLLLSQFNKVNSDVKYQLFKSFCMSVYGCVLWDFSCQYVEKFFIAWRKCVRRIIGVPNNTHCNLVYLLCNDLPVGAQLHLRFLNFFRKSMSSANKCLNLCSRLVLKGSRSKVSNSLNFICERYSMTKDMAVCSDALRLSKHVSDAIYSKMESSDLVAANFLADTLYVRDNNDFSVLSPQEINDVIYYVCTA